MEKKEMKKNHEDYLYKWPFGWTTILIFFAILALFAPIIFSLPPTLYSFPENFDKVATGIGVISPFIAICAAILTYLAFRMQFLANRKMLADSAKQQVERQFYEMLKIHKENVKELKWDNWSISSSSNNNLENLDKGAIWNNRYSFHSEQGRRVFEFHEIEYTFVAGFLITAIGFVNSQEKINIPTNYKEDINIAIKWASTAYHIFMMGADSIKQMFKMNNKINFFEKCETSIDEISKFIENHQSIKSFAKDLKPSNSKLFFNEDPDGLVFLYLFFLLCFFKKNMQPYKFEAKLPSTRYMRGINLFYGHYTELNHYYRHLYQMVNIVANYDSQIMPYTEKRKYLRMLRAQLTNNEQHLLFCNWISGVDFGDDWENEKNHFFTEYRMIHNFKPEDSIIFENIDKESIVKMVKGKNPKYDEYKNDPLFEFEKYNN